MEKTPGQIAYEADIAERPCYFDGKPRASWDELPEICRWSWERETRKEDYPHAIR